MIVSGIIGVYLYLLMNNLSIRNLEQALESSADTSLPQIQALLANLFGVPVALGSGKAYIQASSTDQVVDASGILCGQLIQFKAGLDPEVVTAEIAAMTAASNISQVVLRPPYNGNESFYFSGVFDREFAGFRLDLPERFPAIRQAIDTGLGFTGILELLIGVPDSIVLYTRMSPGPTGAHLSTCGIGLTPLLTIPDVQLNVQDHTGTLSSFNTCPVTQTIGPIQRELLIEHCDLTWTLTFRACNELESRLQNALRAPLLIVMIFVGIGLSGLVYYFFRSSSANTQLEASWNLVSMMRLYIAAIFQYVSHEQKGPIHHMLGSMDILELNLGEPDDQYGVGTLTESSATATQQLQALRNIFTRNLMRVDMVVDAIMNIRSLLSSGAPEIQCRYLSSFIDAFVDKWANVMGSNCNIVLHKDLYMEGKVWNCALDAFLKIVTIGASNASKFGSAYMPVRVFVQVESGYLWFIIVNTVPQEHVSRATDVCGTKRLFYKVQVPHISRATKDYQKRTVVGTDTAKTFSSGSGMGLYAANMLATGCNAVVDYKMTAESGGTFSFTYSVGIPIQLVNIHHEIAPLMITTAPKLRIGFVGSDEATFDRIRGYLNQPLGHYQTLEDIDFKTLDLLIVEVGLGLSPTQVTLRSAKTSVIFIVKDQQSPYMQGIDVHVLHTSFNMYQIRSCVNLASFFVRWDAQRQAQLGQSVNPPMTPSLAGDIVQM